LGDLHSIWPYFITVLQFRFLTVKNSFGEFEPANLPKYAHDTALKNTNNRTARHHIDDKTVLSSVHWEECML